MELNAYDFMMAYDSYPYRGKMSSELRNNILTGQKYSALLVSIGDARTLHLSSGSNRLELLFRRGDILHWDVAVALLEGKRLD